MYYPISIQYNPSKDTEIIILLYNLMTTEWTYSILILLSLSHIINYFRIRHIINSNFYNSCLNVKVSYSLRFLYTYSLTTLKIFDSFFIQIQSIDSRSIYKSRIIRITINFNLKVTFRTIVFSTEYNI